MKKALVAFLLLVSVLFVAGCADGSEDTQPETTETKIITVKLNEDGYTWNYTAGPADMVREIKNEFILDSDGNGTEGKRVYTFEALKNGEVTLTFEYLVESATGKDGERYIEKYSITDGIAKQTSFSSDEIHQSLLLFSFALSEL